MKTFRVLLYFAIALFLKSSVVELINVQQRDNLSSDPNTTKQPPGDPLLQNKHPTLHLNPSPEDLVTSLAPSIVAPPQDSEHPKRQRSTSQSESLQSRPSVFYIPMPSFGSRSKTSDPSAPCSFCAPDTFDQLPPTCKTVCGGSAFNSAGQTVAASSSFTSQLRFCMNCFVPDLEPSCQRMCQASNDGVVSQRESLGIISGPEGVVVGPGGIHIGSTGVELKPKGYIIQYGNNKAADDDLGLGLGRIVIVS